MRPDSCNFVRGERTRRRILESARGILAEGIEACRLGDLSEDAGVTMAANPSTLDQLPRSRRRKSMSSTWAERTQF